MYIKKKKEKKRGEYKRGVGKMLTWRFAVHFGDLGGRFLKLASDGFVNSVNIFFLFPPIFFMRSHLFGIQMSKMLNFLPYQISPYSW